MGLGLTDAMTINVTPVLSPMCKKILKKASRFLCFFAISPLKISYFLVELNQIKQK